jgi:hypothetical protein
MLGYLGDIIHGHFGFSDLGEIVAVLQCLKDLKR